MGSSSPPPFHFGHLITIKLSADNYIFWRAQVLPLLGSHYLLGYVDGSLPCPPALVDSVHGPVYNPAHRVWTGQDQANLSSIQGSLSPAVAGLVVFAKTSHEAWTILERTFAAQSQARVSALRRQLGECQKLDSTATEFYNKVKGLADTLASIGQPLTDSEFNSFIVNGLDEEYDALVEIINERGNSTPMLAHEVFLGSFSLSNGSRLAAPGALAPSRPTPPPRVAALLHHPGLPWGCHRRPPRPPHLLRPYRGLAVHVCASFVVAMGTGPRSVTSASSGVFLVSAMTGRIHATLLVRSPWLIVRRRRSHRDTLSPTPLIPTGTWTLGRQST